MNHISEMGLCVPRPYLEFLNYKKSEQLFTLSFFPLN
jgi:hypothetical protein